VLAQWSQSMGQTAYVKAQCPQKLSTALDQSTWATVDAVTARLEIALNCAAFCKRKRKPRGTWGQARFNLEKTSTEPWE